MRPKSIKKVCCCPLAKVFAPQGCKNIDFDSVELTAEEIEALDLKNNKGFDQAEAAERMGTSQSTFQRILNSAYQKISDALVHGKEIKIQ